MSIESSSSEKNACMGSQIFGGSGCPEQCPGVLTSKLLFETGFTKDGCIVEVCPNPEHLGQPAQEAESCGLGPDVMTIHQTTPLSEEGLKDALKLFGQ